MSDLYKEIEFENDICAHLAAQGWLYAEGDFVAYDRARAVFPADIIAWVQATQPKAWETLSKNHGAAAEPVLLGTYPQATKMTAVRWTCCAMGWSCWGCVSRSVSPSSSPRWR